MGSSEYRAQARYALKGNWGKSVLVCFLGSLLGAGAPLLNLNSQLDEDWAGWFSKIENIPTFRWMLMMSIMLGSVIAVYSMIVFVIGASIQLGQIRFFTGLLKGEYVAVSDLFSQLHLFWKALGLRLVTTIFVSLWAMLFVIPGIIAAFRYSMAPYILQEYPEMGVMEALNASKQMMDGHKMELFLLNLSFFGWMFLGTMTVIGMLWVIPYISAAEAAFYLDLSRPYEQSAYNNGYRNRYSQY